MQFKLLVLSALASIGAAKNLPEAITQLPSCAIPCYVQQAQAAGCKESDFNCICKNIISFTVDVSKCLSSQCSTAAGDTGAALGELCVRWAADPISTEVAAATQTLASIVSSVSATATPGTFGGNGSAPGAKNGVGKLGPAMGLLGALGGAIGFAAMMI